MRVVLLALLVFSCARPDGLRVFAAASLTDVLSEIARGYEERVTFNFGSSSTLARQIDAGAPADLFISADEARMDWLAARNRIVPETRRSLLSNTLVIVVHRDSHLTDLAQMQSIALAEPSTVPAGIYAKAWLERQGHWTEIAPKVIPTENVRGALFAVESGNADAAIVYATDAAISQRVRITQRIENGQLISYPAAVVADAQNRAAAMRFLEHLRSNAATQVFRKHGFQIQNPKSKIQNG